jgi:hypothetical protein
MFDDEDEYFDREPEPEPLLIQAAAVAAGVLLVAVCVWLGVK